MPTIDTYKGAYLWKYIPNLPTAILFAILFTLLTIAHAKKMVKYQTWFCIPFIIGGASMFQKKPPSVNKIANANRLSYRRNDRLCMSRNCNISYGFPRPLPPSSHIHPPAALSVCWNAVHGILSGRTSDSWWTLLAYYSTMVHMVLCWWRSPLSEHTIDRCGIFTKAASGESWKRCHCCRINAAGLDLRRLYVLLLALP